VLVLHKADENKAFKANESIFIKSFVKVQLKIQFQIYQLLAFIHLRSIRTLTSPQMLKITCSYLWRARRNLSLATLNILIRPIRCSTPILRRQFFVFLFLEFGNFGFLSFLVRRCNCLISLKLYHLKPLFGVQLITASPKLISLVFPSFPTITSTISSPLGKTINWFLNVCIFSCLSNIFLLLVVHRSLYRLFSAIYN